MSNCKKLITKHILLTPNHCHNMIQINSTVHIKPGLPVQSNAVLFLFAQKCFCSTSFPVVQHMTFYMVISLTELNVNIFWIHLFKTELFPFLFVALKYSSLQIHEKKVSNFRCFNTVFQRPYRYFSIALKVVFSLSDRYNIFTSNWLWIEICENVVLSKIDIIMTTINKKLWNW